MPSKQHSAVTGLQIEVDIEMYYIVRSHFRSKIPSQGSDSFGKVEISLRVIAQTWAVWTANPTSDTKRGVWFISYGAV